MNEMVVEHTGQQINDYCEKVLNLCLTCRNEGSLMFESVQIIRQLQSELAKAGLERMGFMPGAVIE